VCKPKEPTDFYNSNKITAAEIAQYGKSS